MRRKCYLVLILTALLPVLPALAQQAGQPGSGTSAWGIRAGLASDPDQVVAGVHLFETEIDSNIYLEPNIELGIGDDHVILAVTAPLHYRFKIEAKVQPYAGGGATIGVDRRDRPGGGSDTDFEIALRATGGMIWRLKGGAEMFGELNLIFGDLHQAQVMVGWRF